MPITYEFKETLLQMNFVGEYQPEEIITQFLAAMSDPKCPSRVALLVDVTRSAMLETRGPEEIRRVAEFLGPYKERIGSRCAVVATRNVHFGLSSMGKVYSAGVGVEAGVFRDEKSALEWLGLSAVAG